MEFQTCATHNEDKAMQIRDKKPNRIDYIL
jgi:hypothetical protein